MILPEGLMHRKINIFVALLIILIIAVFAALAISVKAASLNFGGKITTYNPVCTKADPIPGYCAGTICPCGPCQCVRAPCVPPAPQWSEITFTPTPGSNTSFVCPRIGFPYKGLPAPGKAILGNASSVYSPIQIGISK